jgi:type I restriction enzyme R subunit
MVFTEDSRVKIPCILHLVRLGYRYLSLKQTTWDEEANIFPDIFSEAISRINPTIEKYDIDRLLEDVKLTLDNEDLGRAFYEKLTERSGNRLIDFENFSNNSFHVVTELTYKNGDDEFRPDIILLINGMPLAFIEVKKPNNREGVLAERNRINERVVRLAAAAGPVERPWRRLAPLSGCPLCPGSSRISSTVNRSFRGNGSA